MEGDPLVSVIMPVRNEAAYIERSLGTVLAQDYPADCLEMLVVDGLSTDGTREAVLAHAAQRPGLRLLDNPGRIAPAALNVGLSQARGEIVVRVDGHCEIAPDYVRRCVEHLQAGFEGAPIEAVGGPIETVAESDEAAAVALAMGSGFGVGGAALRTIRGRGALGASSRFGLTATSPTPERNGDVSSATWWIFVRPRPGTTTDPDAGTADPVEQCPFLVQP